MAAEISATDVARHMGNAAPDPSLADLIGPVVELVESWKGKPISEWPDRWRLGCMMLIGRMDRRRMSPSGVETVTELGPVYIARKDPEVAQLLEIGTYRKPVVA